MEVNGGNPSINFTIRLFKGYNLFYYHIDVQRNREWTLIPISVICMIPNMMFLLLIMQSIRQMLVQFLKTTTGFPLGFDLKLLCDILLIFREIDINLFDNFILHLMSLIQGVQFEKSQKEIAVALKQCIFNLLLVKPKCV